MIRDRCTGMEGRYVIWRNLYFFFNILNSKNKGGKADYLNGE